MIKLQEHVNLVLPRAGVELVMRWLDDLGPTRGPMAWLRAQLVDVLDRDVPRRATERINTAVGEMTIDELFESVAEVMAMDGRGELADGDRRAAIADALERIRRQS